MTHVLAGPADYSAQLSTSKPVQSARQRDKDDLLFLIAYGVSCRARAESVALHRILRRFAPEAVTPAPNFVPPPPSALSRTRFGVMSRVPRGTLAHSRADSVPGTGELFPESGRTAAEPRDGAARAALRRGRSGCVRRQSGRPVAPRGRRPAAARVEIRARARAGRAGAGSRLPRHAVLHAARGAVAGRPGRGRPRRRLSDREPRRT